MSGAARTATARERLWLKRFAAPLPAGATKLLCFHYAGGSAGSSAIGPRGFRRWRSSAYSFPGARTGSSKNAMPGWIRWWRS